MLNQCQFIGNLGADPDIRTTQSGSKIVNLRLAVSEKWKDRNSGEQRERTEWVPVVIFAEGLAKIAEQYLRKGSKVYVSGQFTTRKWQDQSGADRYSTEVVLRPYNSTLVMLDGKQSGSGDNGSQGGSSGYSGAPAGGADLEDEIPFFMEWRI